MSSIEVSTAVLGLLPSFDGKDSSSPVDSRQGLTEEVFTDYYHLHKLVKSLYNKKAGVYRLAQKPIPVHTGGRGYTLSGYVSANSIDLLMELSNFSLAGRSLTGSYSITKSVEGNLGTTIHKYDFSTKGCSFNWLEEVFTLQTIYSNTGSFQSNKYLLEDPVIIDDTSYTQRDLDQFFDSKNTGLKSQWMNFSKGIKAIIPAILQSAPQVTTGVINHDFLNQAFSHNGEVLPDSNKQMGSIPFHCSIENTSTHFFPHGEGRIGGTLHYEIWDNDFLMLHLEDLTVDITSDGFPSISSFQLNNGGCYILADRHDPLKFSDNWFTGTATINGREYPLTHWWMH